MMIDFPRWQLLEVRPADIKAPRVRGFTLGLDRGWASVLSRTLGIAKMMTSAEEMKFICSVGALITTQG